MSRVGLFAATRADLFPLTAVLAALAAAPDLEPTLLVCGPVELAGLDLSGVDVRRLDVSQATADPAAMAASGAAIGNAVARALVEVGPAAVVVLGDRWELLYAVPPVVLAGVPLVHLHGGEVTEGAVDDRIRHAVTKLADLHAVSTPTAAARLCQMGEPADRVVVTGAPSLDRVGSVTAATDRELADLLGQAVVRPFALVTYHPVTAGGPDPKVGARQVYDAVAATCGTALLTRPGPDAGRAEVDEELVAATARHPHLVGADTLGTRYLPVMAAADVVVGNSSSGIIEAATFGVPVVNVGDRQLGRERNDNVVDVSEHTDAIAEGIAQALTPEFRDKARAAGNRYGDGHAAARVVDLVRRAVDDPNLARKPFVDLEGHP